MRERNLVLQLPHGKKGKGAQTTLSLLGLAALSSSYLLPSIGHKLLLLIV
jgi:hypothetical protein